MERDQGPADWLLDEVTADWGPNDSAPRSADGFVPRPATVEARSADVDNALEETPLVRVWEGIAQTLREEGLIRG